MGSTRLQSQTITVSRANGPLRGALRLSRPAGVVAVRPGCTTVVKDTVGSGGFAKVKVARHRVTGEKVAIKVMDKAHLRKTVGAPAGAHGKRFRTSGWPHAPWCLSSAGREPDPVVGAGLSGRSEARGARDPSPEGAAASERLPALPCCGDRHQIFPGALRVAPAHATLRRSACTASAHRPGPQVLEYAPGGELFDYIVSRDRCKEEEARVFFRQICKAVHFCHQHGPPAAWLYLASRRSPATHLRCCHTDRLRASRSQAREPVVGQRPCMCQHTGPARACCPHLASTQNIKLIDFGLVSHPSNLKTDLLKTCCGSAAYAAPELIRGERYLGAPVRKRKGGTGAGRAGASSSDPSPVRRPAALRLLARRRPPGGYVVAGDPSLRPALRFSPV